MNTETQDIEMLERAILTEVRDEAEQIKAEAEEKADAIRKRAQEQAEAERQAILDRAREEAERLRGQAVATAQLKARSLQLAHREQLLERVFKALADRHRVKILNRLLQAGGEAVCVCDFEELLGLRQSTVSYHLKQLLDAGIVEREKRGSYAYFSLAAGALEHVCGLLGATPAPA